MCFSFKATAISACMFSVPEQWPSKGTDSVANETYSVDKRSFLYFREHTKYVDLMK